MELDVRITNQGPDVAHVVLSYQNEIYLAPRSFIYQPFGIQSSYRSDCELSSKPTCHIELGRRRPGQTVILSD